MLQVERRGRKLLFLLGEVRPSVNLSLVCQGIVNPKHCSFNIQGSCPFKGSQDKYDSRGRKERHCLIGCSLLCSLRHPLSLWLFLIILIKDLWRLERKLFWRPESKMLRGYRCVVFDKLFGRAFISLKHTEQHQINTVWQVIFMVICQVNQCTIIFPALICHGEPLRLVCC